MTQYGTLHQYMIYCSDTSWIIILSLCTYANVSEVEPLGVQDSMREELTVTATVDDDGVSINGASMCVEKRKTVK